MIPTHLSLFATVLLMSFGAPTSTAQAQSLNNANVSATGGAGIAAIADDAVISLNPAGLGMSRRYDFSGAVQNLSGGYATGAKVVDSRTSAFGFGLSYRYAQTNDLSSVDMMPGWVESDSDVANLVEQSTLVAAAGVPLLDRKMAVGFSGTVGWIDSQNRGLSNTFDIAVGVSARPLNWLSFGLVGADLLALEGLDKNAASVAGGFQMAHKRGLLVSDVRWTSGVEDGSALSIHTGGVIKAKSARIRLGYQQLGPTGESSYTWGIGNENNAGGIEYAMQIPTDADGMSGIIHTVSLRIRMPEHGGLYQ